MPRTKASKASDGAASSSAAGDEEDGEKKPRRLPTQEYDQLRDLRRSFSKAMYAMAVAHLEDTRAQDGNELSGRGQNVGKRGKRHGV